MIKTKDGLALWQAGDVVWAEQSVIPRRIRSLFMTYETDGGPWVAGTVYKLNWQEQTVHVGWDMRRGKEASAIQFEIDPKYITDEDWTEPGPVFDPDAWPSFEENCRVRVLSNVRSKSLGDLVLFSKGEIVPAFKEVTWPGERYETTLYKVRPRATMREIEMPTTNIEVA